ncbi:hypothetical protein SVAN01_00365 [Stagonosporopsis vannaccii]|nr:hypothetical protein SVAN01_00365 [Stagonosporopsis vannaccii]
MMILPNAPRGRHTPPLFKMRHPERPKNARFWRPVIAPRGLT